MESSLYNVETGLCGNNDAEFTLNGKNEDAPGDDLDFYIDQSTEKAMAIYKNTEYGIGFLDLTHDEHCILLTTKWSTTLKINSEHIFIHHNKINIKRFYECNMQQNESSFLWQDSADFVRIEFSTTGPLMAKYESDFYFVDDSLQTFYSYLLRRTRQRVGCAIRIERNCLIANVEEKKLAICEFLSHKHKKIITVTSEKSKSLANADIIYNSFIDFRRFLVNDFPCELVEVDSKLIKTLNSTEIYVYEENPQISGFVHDADYNPEDDEFFKQLFTDAAIVPNPLNKVPSGVEDEFEDLEKVVKFFINDTTARIEAEYDEDIYAIGFLDLTQEEQAIMTMINWTVQLHIKRKHIWIYKNKLHIRRIHLPFDQFACIQFLPSSWPLMAKFRDTIHSIGEKFYNEYLDALIRTKNQVGTTIFLNEEYLVVNSEKGSLDIQQFVELKNENIVYLDSALLESNSFFDRYSSDEYQRCIVMNKTCLEVDLTFTQTSICVRPGVRISICQF